MMEVDEMSNEKESEEEVKGGEEEKETLAPAAKENKGLVKGAADAAERLEAANKTMSDNLDRQEALQAKAEEAKAEAALGGSAEAGSEEKKEESPEDYAKRVSENDVEETKPE